MMHQVLQQFGDVEPFLRATSVSQCLWHRLREDISNRQGLFTRPYLLCEQCSNVTYIPYSTSGKSNIYLVNRRSVLGTRCIGGSYSSLAMFCALCDMSFPVSRRTYAKYVKNICDKVLVQLKRVCTVRERKLGS